MERVSIRVEILEGDLVVKSFRTTASGANPGARGVEKVIEEAMGWLQLYQSAVNQPQWENDVHLARTPLPALRLVDQAGG